MATVRFSRSTKDDLLRISAHTLQTANAEYYLDGLERCTKLLADDPSMGQRCDWIRPGLHCFERGRHVLFFRQDEDGILILRVLHQSMLPEDRSFEEAPPEG